MALSQNVVFTGGLPDAEHPPGEPIAQALAGGLEKHGFLVSSVDDWRDCGWVVTCVDCEVSFDVVVTLYSDREWFVQVSPHRVPGVVARIFGARAPNYDSSLYAIACAIADTLALRGHAGFRWRTDGPPRATDPSQPVPP